MDIGPALQIDGEKVGHEIAVDMVVLHRGIALHLTVAGAVVAAMAVAVAAMEGVEDMVEEAVEERKRSRF